MTQWLRRSGRRFRRRRTEPDQPSNRKPSAELKTTESRGRLEVWQRDSDGPQARSRLGTIADAVLDHDRHIARSPIGKRCYRWPRWRAFGVGLKVTFIADATHPPEVCIS